MTVRVSFEMRDSGRRVARLCLDAPRSNALTPDLLQALATALDRVEASGVEAVLISGGRNFSTGGDVAAFHAAALRGEGRSFAENLVPILQDIVFRLVSMPCLVGVAARGAVTGGAAGLLFAADVAAVSPECFVQPYYPTVGFAPDGGWSALLPERVGAGAAAGWLLQDRRVTGPDIVSLGLAEACVEHPEPAVLDALDRGRIGARLVAKALIWDAPRKARLRARLDRETEAFLDLIDRPETLEGMAAFLSRLKEPAHV